MFDLFRDTFPLLWLIIAKLGWRYHTYVCRFMECRLKKCRIKKSEWVISTIIFFLSGSLCLVKPIDVFSPELDREGLYSYIFVYSESSPRWGSRGSTREPRLTSDQLSYLPEKPSKLLGETHQGKLQRPKPLQ